MNDEQIRDMCNDIYTGGEWKPMIDYITNLQEENERLNTELNSYKDEFCKDTIKKYELVMEKEYYKSRCEKAIEYINNLREESAERQEFYYCYPDDLYIPSIDDLLKILGGDE